VRTFLSTHQRATRTRCLEVRRGFGHTVSSFTELMSKIAELAFRNPEYVLLYRGQRQDHKNSKGLSSLYPALFRPETGHRLPTAAFRARFDRLTSAERALAEQYSLLGQTKVRRFQIVRWAILQHYEVCPTPLLDVTHSLRVACSFAFRRGNDEAFVYAFGLPQISGSVTASSEEGVQIVRLLSICPPSALRAHYQEAHLLGEYPTLTLEGKQEYERKEFDFSRRLLCKFHITAGKRFWSRGFQPIPIQALMPENGDRLLRITDGVRGLVS
jgi:FRG domain-containing protein